MDTARALVLGEFAVVGFLTGLIWFVQIVHYPLFARVSPTGFGDYHARHSDLTTRVVAGPMLLDLGLSGLLLFFRPTWLGVVPAALGFALALGTWLCTFFVSVPLHTRLGHGHEQALVARLVATNWLRTVAWTAHLLILAVVISRALP